MRKFTIIAVLTFTSALTGCTDDVPTVPDPVPSEITVGSQQLSQQQFLEKYCAEKTSHETCVKVSRAMASGATRSATGVKRF